MKKINFSIALTFAVVLILLYQIYLAYAYVYWPLFKQPEVQPDANFVRVNVGNYEKIINFLENRESFAPTTGPQRNIFRQ